MKIRQLVQTELMSSNNIVVLFIYVRSRRRLAVTLNIISGVTCS